MGSENKTVTPKEQKKKRGVGGIIVNIIIGIILVFVFIITLNIIISTVTGKGYNSMFGTAFLAVKTESMSTKSGYEPDEGKPAGFEAGSLIMVKEINDDMTFEVGDIITFFAESSSGTIEIVTHRVTMVSINSHKEYVFQTKGDTIKVGDDYAINTAVDHVGSYLNVKNVIGKYTGSKIPGIGYVGTFMETAYGYWLIIGVPALLILIYCIISFVLAVTKRNKVELADEKDKIRLQILNEMRAEQGLAPLDSIPAATAVMTEPVVVEPAPTETVFEPEPEVEVEPEAAIDEEIREESAAEDADDIPVTTEEDMDAAIERIRSELAANFGDDSTDTEPPAEKKPAAKKPASATKSTTAKKTTTASKTTAAKKTTTAKTTTTSSTAKKSTAAKPAAKKSTTSSKGGLIGTGAPKKTTTSKKKTDE